MSKAAFESKAFPRTAPIHYLIGAVRGVELRLEPRAGQLLDGRPGGVFVGE